MYAIKENNIIYWSAPRHFNHPNTTTRCLFANPILFVTFFKPVSRATTHGCHSRLKILTNPNQPKKDSSQNAIPFNPKNVLLIQRRFPYWTSFFVKYADIKSDHHGKSHFNFQVQCPKDPQKVQNYEILRTGCFPYIKYHCTRTNPPNDVNFTNNVIRCCKIATFCVPCLLYGTAAIFLISHKENVESLNGLELYFLLPEDHQARN